MKNIILKMTLSLLFIVLQTNLQASELVVRSESTFNPTHANRFSFMAGLNPSLTKSGDMSNFTFSYGRQTENYWIDTNLAINKGLFKKFSANNPKATLASDAELDEQQNSLTTFGVGIGRETRYSQSLLPIDDIYEMMSANLTYNSYKEDFSRYSFSGPGLLAKFSVYKRFNDYFSAGAHFNYNLAVVKRAQQVETESNSDRSLTIGFLTLGIDLSFYL